MHFGWMNLGVLITIPSEVHHHSSISMSRRKKSNSKEQFSNLLNTYFNILGEEEEEKSRRFGFCLIVIPFINIYIFILLKFYFSKVILA